MSSVSATALSRVIAEVIERFEDPHLAKNGVGNLLVTVRGKCVGYIDVAEAEFHAFDEGSR